MKNTIKLIQEAAGKESNVFGELRSLLASPSPQNYLRIAPIITEQHKSNSKQFQSDIEPYLQAQIDRWPDKAKAVPLDVLIALVNATPSLASSPTELMMGNKPVYSSDKSIPVGVVWIANNATMLDGDKLTLISSKGAAEVKGNSIAFGSSKSIKIKLSFNELNILFKLRAIEQSKLREIVISGVDFEFPDLEILYTIDQKAKSMSKMEWFCKASEVRTNFGVLRGLAYPVRNSNIPNVRELGFTVKYTRPDLFEEHLRAVYDKGYGFEVLTLKIVETRQLGLEEAREIIALVNQDTNRGNQRIIAVDE